MHLNSILFPAPKCSYSIEMLKEELIWIPKYQRKQNFIGRLQTLPNDGKSQQMDIHSLETPRNLIPQMNSKKRMPYTPKVALNNLKKNLNNSKVLTKTPIINDQQCQNHPKKGSKLAEVSDISLPEISDIYEEKSENSLINLRETEFKIFNKISSRKLKESQASYNVSLEDTDIIVQKTGQVLVEKKFLVTGSNLSHNRNHKANLPTRDSSLNETENTPQIRSRGQLLNKRSSNRMSRTFYCGEETGEGDFEEGIANEYPTSISQMASPRNINNYQTKGFSNPHSVTEKSATTRKFLTEITEVSPDKTVRCSTPNTELKFNLFNKLGSTTLFTESIEYHIPCLLLKSRIPTPKILIYFHGNGEDIHLASELLTHIRDHLSINVLAIEYPGYGLYKGTPSEDQVLKDAEAVFDYLTTKAGVHPRNMILFGRSIGSGPATWLASRKNIGALVIMSAFTSIRAVVQHLAGKWAQYLIKERFNNLEHISRVTCPTFIVHGLRDRLIPPNHSQELYKKCRGLSELVLPKDMDHIEFDFGDDFTSPLINFLKKIHFGIELNKNLKMNFPLEVFQAPIEITNRDGQKTARY